MSNGLTVTWSALPHVQAACVLASIRAGSAYESLNYTGICHLLEHLHCATTPSHRTRADLLREFARLGAEWNAQVEPNEIKFKLAVLPDYLYSAIELMSELLRARSFDEALIREELALLESEAAVVASVPERILQAIFPRHGLGLALSSRVGPLRRLSAEQVEEIDHKAFMPDRIHVAIVGPGLDQSLEHARARFSELPASARGRLDEPEPCQPHLPRYVYTWQAAGPALVHGGFVVESPLDVRQRVSLALLGYGLSSPLSPVWEAVRRERTPTYAFETDVVPLRRFRIFSFHGVMPRRGALPFLTRVLGELSRIRDGPTDWFEHVRRKYLFIIRHALDFPESIAARLTDRSVSLDGEAPMSIPEEIDALTELTPEEWSSATRSMLRRERFFLDFRGRKIRRALRTAKKIVATFD
jgi:hypothetical protein